MGEEEERPEVGDVVVNGSKSPEKVEKDVTDNEDQTGVKVIVEDNNNEGSVKVIVEDNNNEGKVDANEKVNAEKIDECKEEAEKENKSTEKEEEMQEAINEAIEEEKGSDEVKQEEDKEDEKGDVSEEKMDDVEESKEKINDVEESKVKVDDVEESKEEMGDVEESKEKINDVEESNVKVDDVEESKEEMGNVQESKEKMDDVEESKEEVGNVEKSKEEIDDVEESKEEIDDVEESKEEIDDVEESKEEMDVKEGKEEMDDVEESKEKMDVVEERKDEMDGVKENQEEKGSKKRKRGKSALEKSGDKAEETEQEPKTPTITNRPVRERKSVERLVAVIEKDMHREFHVEKGRGTRLKDIPNVAYKLSRRKGEDTFKLLHTILFGRRGKAGEIKSNISRFSGFVWRDDEEKQKMKVQEKLDKCVKEKLLEICDVLDIPIAKSIRSTKKDDIVAKLIDFLLVPHPTTAVLLAEKEQSSKGKKRGRDGSASRSLATSPRRPVKSRKKSKDSKREVDKSTSDTEDGSEEEETDNGVPERSEDEISENSDSKGKNDASEESEEDTVKAKKGSKRNSAKKYSAGKGKTTGITTLKRSTSKVKVTPKGSSSSPPKVSHDADTTSPKVFSRKKKNYQGDEEKAPVSKRFASEEKSGKRVVKGSDKPKDDKTKPSEDELRKAVYDTLTRVDFSTATFKDILKELSRQFNTDLSPRKAAIKLMLQDELAKLADEVEEDEEGEGDGNAEQGVVA